MALEKINQEILDLAKKIKVASSIEELSNLAKKNFQLVSGQVVDLLNGNEISFEQKHELQRRFTNDVVTVGRLRYNNLKYSNGTSGKENVSTSTRKQLNETFGFEPHESGFDYQNVIIHQDIDIKVSIQDTQNQLTQNSKPVKLERPKITSTIRVSQMTENFTHPPVKQEPVKIPPQKNLHVPASFTHELPIEPKPIRKKGTFIPKNDTLLDSVTPPSLGNVDTNASVTGNLNDSPTMPRSSRLDSSLPQVTFEPILNLESNSKPPKTRKPLPNKTHELNRSQILQKEDDYETLDLSDHLSKRNDVTLLGNDSFEMLQTPSLPLPKKKKTPKSISSSDSFELPEGQIFGSNKSNSFFQKSEGFGTSDYLFVSEDAKKRREALQDVYNHLKKMREDKTEDFKHESNTLYKIIVADSEFNEQPDEPDEYELAYDAVKEFYRQMVSACDGYIQHGNVEQFRSETSYFINECPQAITLRQHRGMTHFLLSLLIHVLTLGISYIAMALCQWTPTPQLYDTDSARRMDVAGVLIEQAIEKVPLSSNPHTFLNNMGSFNKKDDDVTEYHYPVFNSGPTAE